MRCLNLFGMPGLLQNKEAAMTFSEMLETVEKNLELAAGEHKLLISDVIRMVCDYCNLSENCIPDILEPVIRKKVKGILNYEEANGTGYHPEVASIKEGDGSITWVQTDGNTKESIYGLSSSDKAALRRHRRLRGYD
jgi:hypothetical protein|nr:MAG TPA: head to tail adaptor [Caudoviricetes sp.]DAJ58322.1 MAG TPA: head to tail adaptor [Bacteriophage sp.]